MLTNALYTRREEIPVGFSPDALEPRAAETGVLLCPPDHFRVDYVINPHMADACGRPNVVDPEAARRQWEALRDAYADAGYPVEVISAAPDLPDMVFAANQSFPFIGCDGVRRVVMSRMCSAERRDEVPHYERWYRDRGYEVLSPPLADETLEGMGDLLWVPGRRLLLAGHGLRSSRRMIESLPALLESPVAAFELTDPDFYHLDTAVCPLGSDLALYVRDAFTSAGQSLLAAVFPRLIEAPPDEARSGFAVNAHCPDGRRVILDAACPSTRELLETEGFTVVAVDTSEFRKAGGSVFCLKMMLP